MLLASIDPHVHTVLEKSPRDLIRTSGCLAGTRTGHNRRDPGSGRPWSQSPRLQHLHQALPVLLSWGKIRNTLSVVFFLRLSTYNVLFIHPSIYLSSPCSLCYHSVVTIQSICLSYFVYHQCMGLLSIVCPSIFHLFSEKTKIYLFKSLLQYKTLFKQY